MSLLPTPPPSLRTIPATSDASSTVALRPVVILPVGRVAYHHQAKRGVTALHSSASHSLSETKPPCLSSQRLLLPFAPFRPPPSPPPPLPSAPSSFFRLSPLCACVELGPPLSDINLK
ncbi:hypothetical protein C4D60_Mb04t12160 [Musa balbisiana]|uniref:Uncharacterized protein n=1 Tax=Musa balbisiana TaxID=52838 RepID=A0A4S8KBE8_MUSBA|nr:hypothetical protein C4D60_Mb04t12160 [Musa balbisiana]